MKKISIITLLVSLILIGCSSVPTTKSGETIEGTWVKEDGTTLTVTGKKWELVSMEKGVAGYGTYEFKSKNRVIFTFPRFQNLRYPLSYNSQTYYDELKDFQTKAQEEYNRLYPDKILQYSSSEKAFSGWGDAAWSHGNAYRYYELNWNKLILVAYLPSDLYPNYSTEFIDNYREAMSGQFVRQ